MIAMTKTTMHLRALVEKSADTDLLRKTIGFAAERLMEVEVSAKAGAAYGKNSAERNGYRDRDWRTTPGDVELRIIRLSERPLGRVSIWTSQLALGTSVTALTIWRDYRLIQCDKCGAGRRHRTAA